MSPKIYNIAEPLNLVRLRLAKPINKNGTHFIKTLDLDNPIYFLGPKCFAKHGFVKSGKKVFCDLVFSNEDSGFLAWLENLEETARGCIYENRETWFESPLDEHDIESSMSPPYKPYKSGKYFIVRANVPTALDKINIKVYDENENESDPENIKENTNVLAVLEFQGIRCSVRSFQFEIELKQILIVEPEKIFEKCIISTTQKRNISKSSLECSSINTQDTTIAPSAELTLNTLIVNDNPSQMNHNSVSSLSATDFLPITPASIEIDTLTKLNSLEIIQNTSDSTGSDEVPIPVCIQLTEDANHLISSSSNAAFLPNVDTTNTLNNNYREDDLSSTQIILDDFPTPIEMNDVDFPLDDTVTTEEEPMLKLKSRNDVYYKLYKEMRQRARESKREALANYLEAKRIKNAYLLNDLSDSETDEDDLDNI